MQPGIAALKDEAAKLCQRLRVRRLDVFGSAAGDAFDPARSDIDVLVEFDAEGSGRGFDAYFDLKEGLEALFDRNVDLVVAGAVANPYLRASIEQSRETLYAA